MKKNPFRTIPNILAIAAGVLAVGMVFACITTAFAYNGPSQNPPNGSGAIGSDSSNNVSIGTSTTIPYTKLVVVGAGSGDTGTNALQVLQNNKTPIFILRDDGSVSIETSTISAGNTVIGGNLTIGGTFTASSLGASTISAGNVSAGQFGSNTGASGNYFFINGNVGIGTTAPIVPLQVGTTWMPSPAATGVRLLIDDAVGNSPQNGIELGVFGDSGKQFLIMNNNGSVANTVSASYAVNASNNYVGNITLNAAGSAGTGNVVLQPTGGNVGIGTTNPTTALTVVGNVSSTGVCLSGVCNTTWPNNSQWTATGTAIYYNGGNVGIGTATPTSPLMFGSYGTVTNPAIALANGSTGWYGKSGFADFGFAEAGNTVFAVWTGGAFIPSTNYFGWASTATGDLIGATTDTRIYRTGAGVISLGTSANNNAGGLQAATVALGGATIGTNALAVTGSTIISGNVGIGTTAPGYTLDVNGTGNFVGAVNVGTAVAGTQAVNVNYLNSALASSTAGGITGTVNYLPIFTGAHAIGNSAIYQSGSSVGIGTTAPSQMLSVGSGSPFTVTSAGAVTAATFSGAGTGLTGTAASLTSGALQYLGAQTQNTSGSLTSGLTVGGVYSNGYPTSYGNVLNIGGGGYGQILIGWSGTTGGVADNYIRSLRDSAVGTNNWSAWAKILTDQNYSSYALPLSGGTVTGATTFTQPVYVGTAVAGGQAVNVNYLTAALASTTNTSISGTTGYDAKFTGTNTVGNGNIFESGSNVGIGTTGPGDKLDVNGRIGAQGEYITNNALGQYALSALSIGYDTSAQQAWLQAANSSSVGTLLLNAYGGNVGIGTTAPAAKLDVNGAASFENNVIHNVATPVATSDVATKSYVDSAFAGGSSNGNFATLTVTGNWNISGAAQGGLNMNGYNITGVNILGVTTIDPLYQIGGTDYETFAPSTVGVEEQASGEGTLAKSGSDYEYAINFPKLAQGSDLWVWYQAVDFSKDTVQAIATPYGQFANIYYTIDGSTLTFHGNAPAQFSFQLTGKRFDWQKWPTKAADQTRTPGFVLPVKD